MRSIVLFPGQGSQRRGMGAGLFDEFGALVRAADAIAGCSVQALCESDPDERLDSTQYTQLALYVVNALSYLKWRRDGGQTPDFVAGHSLGEYSALFAAGVFDFETGLRLVKRRAELMAAATGGSMAAVRGMTAKQLEALFETLGITEVDITNTNTPTQIVIAGPIGYLERLENPIRDRGAMLAMLKVSGPFHSRYMREVQRDFEQFIQQFELKTPRIPVISNVTARPYKDNDVRHNLVEQLCQPVRWLESMEFLLDQPEPHFEVVGPSRQLSKMLDEIQSSRSAQVALESEAPSEARAETIADILHRRAQEHPDELAFRYLPTGAVDGPEETWSYAELDRRARVLAAQLKAAGVAPGDRLLLLYPPGLDFISAFFGCLYGGFVPVPTHPPDPTRAASTLPRLHAIVRDAEPRMILSVDWIVQLIANGHVGAELAEIPSLGTDLVEPSAQPAWERPDRAELSPDTLAFIQYTSGSTSQPKGVMVTHANLLHNVGEIAAVTGRALRLASWLPASHDMGLIGGLLYPVFVGGHETIISPLEFLKRPIRWLQVISHYRVELAAGPNFAFDLCVEKSTEAERASVDLSSWRFVLNGAENVRASTIDRFCAAFAASGIRRSSLTPCYGLAEATLMVCSVPGGVEPSQLAVDATALQRNVVAVATTPQHAHPIVSSGTLSHSTEIAIVDPDSLKRRGNGEVGEIWVRSGSVARGYWRREELTAQTFGAKLSSGEGPFLRTGDLGFLHGGNLFVTGRLKDLLIVRGRNVYPQDIEATVERAVRDLRRGCTAAFSVTIADEERLVVIAEVKAEEGFDLAAARAAIRNAVVGEHELAPHAVVLIQPRSIPKTTSGKLQRSACRDLYLSGGLAVVTGGAPSVAPRPAIIPLRASEQLHSRAASDIAGWLVQRIAAARKFPVALIDPQTPFRNLGLESRDMVSLAGELEVWLGRRLAPTLAYEYPSIALLSEHLAARSSVRPPSERAKARVASNEAIAVVGIGCKFPRANGAEAFWNLLQNGVDAVREVPADRWDIDALYDPDPDVRGRMYARHGGFIDDVDKFDAAFFWISPREAEEMDPQHRLLLEVTWEALEDAGIAPDRLTGSATGVFMGISSHDYAQRRSFARDLANVGAYSGTGLSASTAVGRISYVLGLRGPSLAIDTACSSSLVAVHNAAQALRAGDCDLALAGGVNLILAPQSSVYLCRIGALAKTGRCRTFDRSADGYVRGEGCGVVVLKRLVDAERDGDNILAVIRGSAINQDGRSNGLTAPNGDAQRQLLEQALANAELQPADVGYVEAHGTGTPLGDPIEASALDDSYGRARDDKLLVGSVKTNIGHLEAAAGIAGLIKVVLALRERKIPAHLHFEHPNPHIDWGRTSLAIPTRTVPWQSARRVAGVSAFGFGGTNAHVLLEEYLPQPSASVATGPALLVFSAQAAAQLRELVERHLAFIARRRERGPGFLHSLAYTLQVGRAALSERLAVVASDLDSLVAKLEAFLGGEHAPNTYRNDPKQPSPAFELLQEEPAAAEAFTRELLDKRRLDRVAALWVHGLRVEWPRLHRGGAPGVLRAPTYPFARKRHWLEETTPTAVAPQHAERARPSNELRAVPAPELLILLVQRLTKTSREQIKLEHTLAEAGVDSLIAMELLIQIERAAGVRIHLADLRKRPTLAEIAKLVESRKHRTLGVRDRYPELEVMQEGNLLTPVFWFHGGFGTVQPYVPLVRAIGGDLPFYAIQARGMRTDDPPITDLVEMGTYYADIIRHVHPTGDCQIGGYSHGGRVAYEVARQLQLRGRRVKNIVMIDSAYPLKIQMTERTRYIISLFNFLKTAKISISREEMTEILSAADLVTALASFGVKRGLRYTELELKSMLRRMATVLGANLAACNQYVEHLEDLPDPSVPAHYFVRGQQAVSYGPFLGETMPREGEIAEGLRALNRLFDRDEVKLWRTKLPQIQAVRTSSEDHMTMFDDAETIRTIATVCRRVYGVDDLERARPHEIVRVNGRADFAE